MAEIDRSEIILLSATKMSEGEKDNPFTAPYNYHFSLEYEGRKFFILHYISEEFEADKEAFKCFKETTLIDQAEDWLVDNYHHNKKREWHGLY